MQDKHLPERRQMLRGGERRAQAQMRLLQRVRGPVLRAASVGRVPVAAAGRQHRAPRRPHRLPHLPAARLLPPQRVSRRPRLQRLQGRLRLLGQRRGQERQGRAAL